MASTRAPASTSSRRESRQKSRQLVLVVDDMSDNREMYMEYLELRGFAAAGALDGASAIESARRLRPIAILMDLSLPGTDGLEATRILKSDPLTRDIIIVALTGHAGAAHRQQALEAGCDLFITKPSPPDAVLKQLLTAIEVAQRRADVPRED